MLAQHRRQSLLAANSGKDNCPIEATTNVNGIFSYLKVFVHLHPFAVVLFEQLRRITDTEQKVLLVKLAGHPTTGSCLIFIVYSYGFSALAPSVPPPPRKRSFPELVI